MPRIFHQGSRRSVVTVAETLTDLQPPRRQVEGVLQKESAADRKISALCGCWFEGFKLMFVCAGCYRN